MDEQMYRSLNYRAAHTQYVQENRISGQVMVKALIDTNALLELNSPICPMTVITPSDFVAAMK